MKIIILKILLALLLSQDALIAQVNRDYQRLFNDGKLDLVVRVVNASLENQSNENKKLLADAHMSRARASYYGYLLLIKSTSDLVNKHPLMGKSIGQQTLKEIEIREALFRNNHNQLNTLTRDLPEVSDWRVTTTSNPVPAFKRGQFDGDTCSRPNNSRTKECELLRLTYFDSDITLSTYKKIIELQKELYEFRTSHYLERLTELNKNSKELSLFLIDTIDRYYLSYKSDLKAALIIYRHLNNSEDVTPLLKLGAPNFNFSPLSAATNNPRLSLVESVLKGTQNCQNTDNISSIIPSPRSGLVPFSYSLILLNSCISANTLMQLSFNEMTNLNVTRREESLTLARAYVSVNQDEKALPILNLHLTRSLIFNLPQAQPLSISLSSYLRYIDGRVENLNDSRRQLSILQENIVSFSPVFLMVQLSTLPDLNLAGSNPSLYID